jgi:hypothetical protein
MVVLRDAFHPRIDAIELGPRLARWIISGNVGLRKPASCILGDSDAEIWDGSSRLLTPSFNLELAGFWIQNSRHGSIDRVNYVFMVGDENSAFTQRNFSFCCCGGEKDFFKVVFSGGTYEPGKAKNNFSQ